MELEQYRTRLEQMVEEKSKDLIAIQENLEATNRRQALFIKVLQILQLEPDIPTAMNMALAEIGRYTGVDRFLGSEVHINFRFARTGDTPQQHGRAIGKHGTDLLGSLPLRSGKRRQTKLRTASHRTGCDLPFDTGQ